MSTWQARKTGSALTTISVTTLWGVRGVAMATPAGTHTVLTLCDAIYIVVVTVSREQHLFLLTCTWVELERQDGGRGMDGWDELYLLQG